jgi:multimeric flavodoxin WrbA
MDPADAALPNVRRRLLIVYHTQFGATAQLAAAAYRGACEIAEADTVLLRAAEAGVDDLLRCDALLVATSENFGSLSGMVKDFFERVYYPCEGRVDGKPYSVIVCAGNDGSGAMMHTDRIATGLRLSKVHPGLVCKSGLVAQPHTVPAATLAACAELGGTLAAGIAAGIF